MSSSWTLSLISSLLFFSLPLLLLLLVLWVLGCITLLLGVALLTCALRLLLLLWLLLLLLFRWLLNLILALGLLTLLLRKRSLVYWLIVNTTFNFFLFFLLIRLALHFAFSRNFILTFRGRFNLLILWIYFIILWLFHRWFELTITFCKYIVVVLKLSCWNRSIFLALCVRISWRL